MLHAVKLILNVHTHSIAAARLLFNFKRLPLLLSCGKSGAIMTNSTKQAKAIQEVSNIQAFRLIAEMKQHLQSAGGLKAVMQLTNNFAYTLSETKANDGDLPAVKVGRKSFYLSSVGAVNEANVLNVIKSVLKVEDAKRVLAKRLAKRLDFSAFCETKETVTRIECMKDGARLVGRELTEKQIEEAKHRLYNEYLQTLGLDE